MKAKLLWLKLCVSIAACSVLLWWVDWDHFSQILLTANGYWLLIVFGLINLDRLLMAYKWQLLLNNTGVHATKSQVLLAYYAGGFWGILLPASVGGDLVRIHWLERQLSHGAQIALSVLIERLLGIIALAAFALIGFFLSVFFFQVGLWALMVMVLLLLVGAIVSIIWVLFSSSGYNTLVRFSHLIPSKRISAAVEKIGTAIRDYKKPTILGLFLWLSLLEQLFPIVGTYMLAKAFDIQLPLIWAFIGVPIILAVSRFPISLNSFGVQEGIYALVLSFAGVPASASVLMAITGRILVVFSVLPGGLCSVISSRDYTPV